MEKIYWSTSDLAEELRCSERKIDDLVMNGELPKPTIKGRPFYWHIKALEKHALIKLRNSLANASGVQSVPALRSDSGCKSGKSV